VLEDMATFKLVCLFPYGSTNVTRVLSHFEVEAGYQESIHSVKSKVEQLCGCIVDHLVLDATDTVMEPENLLLSDFGIGAGDVIVVVPKDPPAGVGVPSPVMLPLALYYRAADGNPRGVDMAFDTDDTIDNVKAKIQHEIGIDYDFHLVLDGTTLLSEWTLRDYILEDFDVLTIRRVD
jgi:hypothetical protein